jgi:uncharacterized phage protein (TIGR02218 family)
MRRHSLKRLQRISTRLRPRTCHAWRLTRTDGLVIGFTEHDHDARIFDGTVFSAATGFRASEVETGLGLEADAANVAGAFSDAAISTDDLALGRYDGARVETFLVNWQSPGDHVLLSTRELGEVRTAGQAFTVELRSLAASLDQPHGPALWTALRCRSRRSALRQGCFGGAVYAGWNHSRA